MKEAIAEREDFSGHEEPREVDAELESEFYQELIRESKLYHEEKRLYELYALQNPIEDQLTLER